MMMLYLVHQLIERHQVCNSKDVCLIDGDRSWTYGELAQQVRQMANGLNALGIQRGARIGVFLEPCSEIAQAMFAISMVGGVFVPIHHSLLKDQLGHIIDDCGIEMVVTSSNLMKRFPFPSVNSGCLRTVVTIDECRDPCEYRQISLREVVKLGGGAVVSNSENGRTEQDLAAVLYTSGSTGKSKGVMLSHRNVIAGAEIVASYLRMTSSDRVLAALPFSFDAGLNQLTSTMLVGGTVILSRFVFGKDLVDQLVEHRITGLAGVPSLWCLLAHSTSTLNRRRPSELRYITNTGGALPLGVLSDLRRALPETEVFLMYGLTEAFRSTYLQPSELDRRPTSMGKAIPNTEILVLNTDGSRCLPGEIGELVHRGPTVCLGYWGDPEMTGRVFRQLPAADLIPARRERVVFSGDLVKTDKDGFFYFVGRKDNMIKTSGFRVSPTEVEVGLCKTGLIDNAAVVGIEDERLGQKIVAFVVALDPNRFDARRLLKMSASVLPSHMLPKEVNVVDSLPKNTNGKVNYGELRNWVLQPGSAPR